MLTKYSLFTNSLFGWLLRAICRFKTLTGVTKPPKLLAAVVGAMLLTVRFPCPWGWLLIGFREGGAPVPGVIPYTTWLVTLVCKGAGGPSTEPALVEVVASTMLVPSKCAWHG